MARLSSFVLLAAMFALLLAAPVHAGLLSGALPGLVSPADTPETCDTTASQPFARWGDKAYYVLAPGGAFEPGSPTWTLKGGARVVRGNETFYVHSPGDAYSLYLPAGSSATTPAMCFDFGDWKVRFFSVGSSATLRVRVVVKSLLGVVSILDAGTVSSGSTWYPSPEMRLLLTNVSGLLATDSISLRFVPIGRASVRVDDVYLDPWKVS